MAYNWQLPDWPHFKYNIEEIEDQLLEFTKRTARMSGILDTLPEEAKIETLLEIIVLEAIKTSEIEGEYISRKDVMSSVKRNLGIVPQEETKDQRAEGIAGLMTQVREFYQKSLSEPMLFEWHKTLMTRSGDIQTGKWRTHQEPMQVVSGALGKEKVHFEAPPSSNVPDEMGSFIQWFNNTAPGGMQEIKSPPVRSALAHIYFESIHPFEDGNGRIGRAISEKALSQGAGYPVLLSLSESIESNKKLYYSQLQKAQSTNEITNWIKYFVDIIIESLTRAEELVNFTLKKARLFDKHKVDFNDRQIKVIQRMLEEGPGGFEGGMNARKYMGIVKTSKATATRDLQNLVEIGVLHPVGGGRSTRYNLKLD